MVAGINSLALTANCSRHGFILPFTELYYNHVAVYVTSPEDGISNFPGEQSEIDGMKIYNDFLGQMIFKNTFVYYMALFS